MAASNSSLWDVEIKFISLLALLKNLCTSLNWKLSFMAFLIVY